MILRGLSSALGSQPDFMVLALCADGAGCLEAIRMFQPDVTIVGTLPDLNGTEIVAVADFESPSTHVVLFGDCAEDHDQQPLKLASAIIPQDVSLDILAQLLRQIGDGQRLRPFGRAVSQQQTVIAEKSVTTLTARERLIVRLVCEGLSNKEIGRRLALTDGTIKVHLHRIFQKLRVGNRTALAMFDHWKNGGR